MRFPTSDDVTALLGEHKSPCLTIYQPTQRSYPARQEDHVRFRNLLKEAETELAGKLPERKARAVVEKVRALADDNQFWTRRTAGLAVLASEDTVRVFDLPRPPRREQVTVADSFHVKPLLRAVQSADRFQVLCLHRDRVRLLEGSRDALDEADLKGMPATATELLGNVIIAQHQEVPPRGGPPTHHREPPDHPNHPSKSTGDANVDTERFFTAVDREVWERHSKPSGLPLLLAGLPEHVTLFRTLSHNQHLLPGAIEKDPDSMSAEELREAAWRQVEPLYLQRLAQFCDDFRTAQARGMATDDLTLAAEAAAAGRVGVLLVDADREYPGKLDSASGRVEVGGPAGEAVDDVLDDLAELVLARKGTVVVVPSDRMPTQTGLAATFRF